MKKENRWYLGLLTTEQGVKTFDSVASLVRYYGANDVYKGLRLLNGIPRPEWLVKHRQIQYKITDTLGSGNFGDVYKGRYAKREETIQVAIKVGKKTGESTEEAKKWREEMVKEAKTMSFFVHENLVTFHGAALDHRPIIILLEFCAGGALDRHLQNQKGRVTGFERMTYVMEAARGMRYLHQKQCIHRDLAARNCLIANDGIIKIADFGMSKFLKNDDKPMEVEMDGKAEIPLRWMAPESLRKPYMFSKATDVWSFGVLMFEVFNNGVKPWQDWEFKKIAKSIRRIEMPTLPAKTPTLLVELIRRIWIRDAEARPTFSQINEKIWKILERMEPMPPSLFTLNNLKGVKREIELKAEDIEKDGTNSPTGNAQRV